MDTVPVCILAIKDEEDREFMQTLYTKYMRLMYRCAYRVTHNAADAEDAVSAACESLVQCVDRLKGISPKAHPAYVSTAVRNAALMLLRRRKVELRAFSKLAASNLLPQETPPHDTELQQLYGHTLQEVEDAILRLSSSDQMILRMRFFDHLSDTEISVLLEIQPDAVRARISRARRRLLKALKEKQDEQ